MKIKLFFLFTFSLFILGCASSDDRGTLYERGAVKESTYDSIECFGSCSVKIYNVPDSE